jgi:hypothetical protein
VWAHSHNGIDFINGLFPNNLPEEQYLNHDCISRVNLLDVGASSTYAITRKTNLFVGWGHSINGTNTHLRDSAQRRSGQDVRGPLARREGFGAAVGGIE